MSKDEIWNTFLDDFNKESAKQMEYSSATADELEKIEDDVNAGK
jgi:predicted PolB exonuclease-like 3'-5' exonuclease